MEKKLYTLLVYSENVPGILSQVSAVFTRQQVNITAWSYEEEIKKITKLIERKIDVVKADYYLDDELFIHEIAIYKIATPALMANPEVSRVIRRSGARMLEVNPTYTTVQVAGLTDDVQDLYNKLHAFGCLLQYSRSGRVAVTRSTEEPLAEFLHKNKDI